MVVALNAVVDVVQGSDAWRLARCGSLGASSVHEVVAKTRSGPSASRQNCLTRLVLERLTGRPQDTFKTPAMIAGTEREPLARAAYEVAHGVFVTEVGLVRHPTIAWTHASPDGLVGDAGLLEIKCPQPAAHLEVLMTGKVPDKYLTQMAWQMACTGSEWCDFASWSSDFPEHLQLWERRVDRDDELIAELETEVREFLAEVEAAVERLGGGQ